MYDEPRQKALDLYREAKNLHDHVFICMQRMKDGLLQHQDLEQVVDIVAVLKKADEMLKDTKHQVSELNGKLQEIACKMYMQSTLIPEPVRTEWVTGTPDVKVKPSLPTLKNDPQAYYQMCLDMGYKPSTDLELFRPHYPGIQQLLGGMQERAEQLPEWVNPNKSGSEFTVRCLWKRSVDLDSLVGFDASEQKLPEPPEQVNNLDSSKPSWMK